LCNECIRRLPVEVERGGEGKLSKIETLRAAANYILALQVTLLTFLFI
jgi:hypothetical protein